MGWTYEVIGKKVSGSERVGIGYTKAKTKQVKSHSCQINDGKRAGEEQDQSIH